MEVGLTYLWQEESGKKYYRVQTDDKDIAKKLFRRNGFRLSGYGMNSDSANGTSLWIFVVSFQDRILQGKLLNRLHGKCQN